MVLRDKNSFHCNYDFGDDWRYLVEARDCTTPDYRIIHAKAEKSRARSYYDPTSYHSIKINRDMRWAVSWRGRGKYHATAILLRNPKMKSVPNTIQFVGLAHELNS